MLACALGLALGLAADLCELPCTRQSKARDWTAATRSCGADAATNPNHALAAGRAALYLARFDEADVFARDALRLQPADAVALLGATALGRGSPDAALIYLLVADGLHARLGDKAGRARDAQQLAGVWFMRGEYSAAREAATLAHDLATELGDRGMLVYADIARADASRALGALDDAEEIQQQVVAEVTEPSDKITAQLKQAILYIDLGHPALAAAPLVEALAAERRAAAPRPTILRALLLNLAEVERAAGHPEDALAQVEAAKGYDTQEMSYRFERGRIFATAGRFDEAAAELAAAELARPTGELAYEVPLWRARVAAWAGDIAAAIVADRRAIDWVTMSAAEAGALGPTLVANFREPHLHLVGVYGSQRDWPAALDVIALLDTQALLVSSASPVDSAPALPPATAAGAARPASAPVAAQDIIDAWRDHPLVIIVPDGERMWRLVVRDGRVDGSLLGPAAPLVELARMLARDPRNALAGLVLGDTLLPGDLPAGARIDLLLVGPVARAPSGALRFGGSAAVAHWQLARVLGVLPRSGSPAPSAPARAVVLGDPTGDLPQSASEATNAARELDGTLFLAAAATRSALASARNSSVLHIASHARLRGTTSVLVLADGEATARDVAALAPAPRLVVLASCASATGSDDTGNGSLAMAFVDAGAETVVATQHSIDDRDAARFFEAFYAEHGAGDPFRALAEAQAELARETPARTDWAAFEVIAGRPRRR